MKEDDAEAAIRMVHEAALRPETWPDALRGLARACGATCATAMMADAGGHVIVPSRGDEAILDDYFAGGWQQRNKRIECGMALTGAGVRGFITEYMMFGPQELARDPFQQEYASRHGMDAEAGTVVASHAGSSLILTVPRSTRAGSYWGAELESMNRLAAMLSAASSFALRFKLASAGMIMDTLGARGEALALLTSTGRVLHVTAALETLLRGRLTQRQGCVHAIDPQDDDLLQGLILRCGHLPARPGQVLPPVVLRRQPGPPLIVRCLPVVGEARDLLGMARTILAVDDMRPASLDGAETVLRALYGLTRAEALMAINVGEGKSVREAADAQKVAFETARTRLKAIYQKTGTSRQSELALLVARTGRA